MIEAGRTLTDADVDAIARRVTELVAECGVAPAVGYATAAELEQRYGISRDWFYARKDHLGAVRMGNGKRPRLRFDVRLVEELLAAVRAPTRDAAPAKHGQQRPRAARRRRTGVPLLQVRG